MPSRKNRPSKMRAPAIPDPRDVVADQENEKKIENEKKTDVLVSVVENAMALSDTTLGSSLENETMRSDANLADAMAALDREIKIARPTIVPPAAPTITPAVPPVPAAPVSASQFAASRGMTLAELLGKARGCPTLGGGKNGNRKGRGPSIAGAMDVPGHTSAASATLRRIAHDIACARFVATPAGRIIVAPCQTLWSDMTLAQSVEGMDDRPRWGIIAEHSTLHLRDGRRIRYACLAPDAETRIRNLGCPVAEMTPAMLAGNDRAARARANAARATRNARGNATASDVRDIPFATSQDVALLLNP